MKAQPLFTVRGYINDVSDSTDGKWAFVSIVTPMVVSSPKGNFIADASQARALGETVRCIVPFEDGKQFKAVNKNSRDSLFVFELAVSATLYKGNPQTNFNLISFRPVRSRSGDEPLTTIEQIEPFPPLPVAT